MICNLHHLRFSHGIAGPNRRSMEDINDSSNEKHTRTHSLSLTTAKRYSQPIPAQTTKTPQSEGGAARSQQMTRQPRAHSPPIPTPSFLENAAAKMGKMAHTVTQKSPVKIRNTLTGNNKKRALEIEHATTPTPQTYNDEGPIVGGPIGPGSPNQWDEDINSSGDEDEGATDHVSMQTDTSYNWWCTILG